MTLPPPEPERLTDATAQRLLERASTLDADGPTLAQLRQSAIEAGISEAAFNTALAEWRENRQASPPPIEKKSSWIDNIGRNIVAFGIGYLILIAISLPQNILGTPWLLHKFTDSLGCAIGAVIASRLRARGATILLAGLAISQGAEFLMDASTGAPAIQGFGAHMGLMIAGVAGVLLGRALWGRSRRQNDEQPPVGSTAGAR